MLMGGAYIASRYGGMCGASWPDVVYVTGRQIKRDKLRQTPTERRVEN
jgi:hypothetical protein